MPCPPNFDWDPYVKKCYSIQLLGPAFWTDAVHQCRNTHPRSKLVEPRNALENRRLGVLAGCDKEYTANTYLSLKVVIVM